MTLRRCRTLSCNRRCKKNAEKGEEHAVGEGGAMRRQYRGVSNVVAETAQGEDGVIPTTRQGMGLGWRHHCCEKPSGEAAVHELTTETELESNDSGDDETEKWKTSRGGVQVERREEHEPEMLLVFGQGALARILGHHARPSREEPQGNLIGGMTTTWRIAPATRVRGGGGEHQERDVHQERR